jgi:hypothetical protein
MTFFILMFFVVYISPVFFCAGLEAFARAPLPSASVAGNERSALQPEINGTAGMNMTSRKHIDLGSTIVADA